MNVYTTEFKRQCPSNGISITYRLRIESSRTVMVENIQAVIDDLPPHAYHEDLAEMLSTLLPGRQTLTAHHHGVDIRTER